jgi:hypothetical protein
MISSPVAFDGPLDILTWSGETVVHDAMGTCLGLMRPTAGPTFHH